MKSMNYFICRALLCAAALFAYFCSGFVFAEGKGMTIKDLAISPDGRMVAFQYEDEESKRQGLGLLDWKAGKITPIPSPPGKDVSNASFADDGKRILAMTSDRGSGQIVSIDLATLKMSQLMQARRGWQAPAFQPGTDNILIVAGGLGTYYHLRLVNPKDGTETTILDEKHGFIAGIFHPYFVAQDEIVFQAITPVDPQQLQEVLALVPKDTETIAYRLHFGGRPQIILADMTENKADPVNRGIGFVSATADGKRLAFIAKSRIEPSTERGAYNLEVFTLTDGVLKQVTDLRSFMSYARMSRDGSTVVLSSLPNSNLRSNPRFAGLAPSVLDLRTGKVTPTNLNELLQKRPDFRLPSSR